MDQVLASLCSMITSTVTTIIIIRTMSGVLTTLQGVIGSVGLEAACHGLIVKGMGSSA